MPPTPGNRHAKRVATCLIASASTVLLSGVVPTTAHAGFSAIIYVSPGGSGTMCSQAAPCTLTYGLGHAGTNTEVVVTPGTYGSHAVPISSGLDDNNNQLNIHGVAGAAPPVIYTSTTYGFLLTSGSSLRHVFIIGSGAYALSTVDSDVTITGVVAENTSNGEVACGVFSTLTDSICLATGAGGYAVSLAAGASGPGQYVISAAMRNVTAIATGVGGVGVFADTGAFTTMTVTATNTIALGAGYDVDAYAGAATSNATIVMDHSAYNSAKEDVHVVGGMATVTPIAQVATPPMLTSSYHEAGSSPTVNAGTTSGVAAGETDLDGNPRVLGHTVDIGAFERPQKPTTKKLKAKKESHTSAHFTVKVNAEGLTTSLKLVATRHGHHIKSAVKSAGKGRHAKKRKIAVHGLKPGTSYHVHAIAKNAAGKAKGKAVKVHTTG